MNSGRICSCRCARQCRDLVGVVSQSFLNQLARKSRIVDTNTHQTAKVSQGSERKALGNDPLFGCPRSRSHNHANSLSGV